jgi:hypothetical protein
LRITPYEKVNFPYIFLCLANLAEPPRSIRFFRSNPTRLLCKETLEFIYIIVYMPLGFRSKVPGSFQSSPLGPQIFKEPYLSCFNSVFIRSNCVRSIMM